MVDAVERLVNLAFYLAAAAEPVSAERIRVDVTGYPAEQDEDAFKRMFERDKELLREAGFTILTDAENEGYYRLDRAASFSEGIDLTPEQAAAVRVAGTAMLADPSFPFPDELRLALAKIASALDGGSATATARLADEDPQRQGAVVADLAAAAETCKRVTFGYTNSYGESAPHEVEPYGVFLHDGRWYLVGRDIAKDDVRTYTVARMAETTINAARPKSPDFARPEGFDVRSYLRLPFQYGPDSARFEAVLRFSADAAWRAGSLAAGQGSLAPDPDGDGSVFWTVEARSRERLLRFALENGPGMRVVEPADLTEQLTRGLEEVVRLHG